MKNSNSLIAFIAGAVMGGVAGLLMAPGKGEDTRKKLSKAANKIKDDLSSEVDKRMSDLESLAGKASGLWQDKSKEISKTASNAKNDLEKKAKSAG